MTWITRALVSVALCGGCGGASSAVVDTDGDGLPDGDDLCPRDAEELDGVDDEDGCPDRDRHCPGPFAILDTIEMEPGSDAPAGRYAPILDAVAETLAGNPNVGLLEVRGHVVDEDADERGDLGLRRAEAIAAELRARGVAEARLRAVDLEARCPLDASRRAPASRVDFRFLEIDGERVLYEDACTRLAGDEESGTCP